MFLVSSQGALVIKNLLVSAGDMRRGFNLPLGGEDPPEGGHGNLLQDSYLENPMDSGAWCGLQSTGLQSCTQLK